jgi:hypothetical protein
MLVLKNTNEMQGETGENRDRFNNSPHSPMKDANSTYLEDSNHLKMHRTYFLKSSDSKILHILRPSNYLAKQK